MQYHNFHTHSIYSDGKYTLREMTDAAIEKGFTNLGFSDHSNNRVESYSVSYTHLTLPTKRIV